MDPEYDMAHPALMNMIRSPALASSSKAAKVAETAEAATHFHNVRQQRNCHLALPEP
jgi:hypothetical protein